MHLPLNTMIRYISDQHFSHRNIIRYDDRPFNSVEEMDEAMISMWNDEVSEKDTTYILGDVIWQSREEDWERILKALKGKKFIVKGNHDETSTLRKLAKNGVIEGWEHQTIVSDNGRKVILNHSPMPFFVNQHHDGWYHLYGHVHTSFDYKMILSLQRSIEDLYQHPIEMYNCGCMLYYMSYIPQTLDWIVEKGREEFNRRIANMNDKDYTGRQHDNR